MKKCIVLVLLPMVTVSSRLPAQTRGIATFTVTTTQTSGNYEPRHVLAVWVADSSGAFVKTLLRRADRRQQYLYTWQNVSAGNVVDAVTGATLSTHQTVTATWDTENVSGNIVPDGEYRIRVEFTAEHAQGPLTPATYVSFQKGPDEVTLHPADLQYFKSMSLTYRPDKATHTLLPAGSEWKYSDRGVDLHSTGWKLIDYDDSGWSTGIGVFGFGDAADTVLSFGPDSSNVYPCYYFRRTLDAGFAPTDLKVRLLRDDGAILYINGKEVLRSNMPAGTVGYATLASATVGGTEERAFFDYFIDASDLVAGENILAAEVHQSAATSGDLGFDLELMSSPPPEDPATFFRGDADGNETRELTDAVVVLEFLFQSGAAPSCLAAADSNDDDVIDISDPILLLFSLFGGTVTPAPPYPDCGVDPTAGALGCASSTAC